MTSQQKTALWYTFQALFGLLLLIVIIIGCICGIVWLAETAEKSRSGMHLVLGVIGGIVIILLGMACYSSYKRELRRLE